MRKNLKPLLGKWLIAGFMAWLLLVFAAPFVWAQANDTATLFGGEAIKTQTQENLGLAEQDPRDTIAKVINVAIGFLGIIAVALTMYGGYVWMTSGGNPEKIDKAKNILKNSAIGLLIILSAWAIVNFIFSMWLGGGGGSGGGGDITKRGGGIGALGSGILETVYPEPNQTDVPRNTALIVTFREKIKASTICEGGDDAAGACSGGGIASSSASGALNVRIYRTQQAAACEKPDPDTASSSCKLFQARVFSNDGKTFVFKPDEYLGSPSEDLWHTAYLTDDIKKANGDDAFRRFDTVRDQSWSFEVTNEIDLDPPRVIEGGVLPAPDNAADQTLAQTFGTQARGGILMIDTPQAEVPTTIDSFTSSPGAPAATGATVSSACDKSVVTVYYDANAKIFVSTADTATSGQATLSSDNQTLNFDFCEFKLKFSTDLALAAIPAGAFWTVNLNRGSSADTITIGDQVYTAAAADSTDRLEFSILTPMASLANLINANPSSPVTASVVSASELGILAKDANSGGNNIFMSSNNPARLQVSPLSGGQDLKKAVAIRSRRDKPMNTIIQINFNEAMNPLTLVGSSSDVRNSIRAFVAGGAAAGAACSKDGDCRSGKCFSNACVGDIIDGHYVISNVYKTIEFISNNQCGVNGCGENIYCLPPMSNIRIEVAAARLDSCASNADCASRSPFSACDDRKSAWLVSTSSYASRVCQDQASTTAISNYPQIGFAAIEGSMDAAFNSLDGNRDMAAQGPMTDTATNQPLYYQENNLYGMCAGGTNPDRACMLSNRDSACGIGTQCQGAQDPLVAQAFADNFAFSFFVNDTLKITPPQIRNQLGPYPLAPRLNDVGVSLYESMKIDWSDPMMSASITTGERQTKVEGQASPVVHKHLNIGSYTGQPTGYWGKTVPKDNQPADGEIDWTQAEIGHADFDSSMKYWAQAGSGLRDVYQNCFKPSAGPQSITGGTCAVTDAQASCCHGVPQAIDVKTGIKPACN